MNTMYDKVRFWLGCVLDSGRQEAIAQHLTDASTQINCRTGDIRTVGSLESLRVSLFADGLSLMGSLPKYLYGSNVYPLDIDSTAEVLEKISDVLHMDIANADVRSLEFGTVFQMRRKVSDYLDRLDDMPRKIRCRATDTSLYYRGCGRRQYKSFNFYDKIIEAKSKGMDYPSNLKSANLLRYEMRLVGSLGRQLKEPPVKASVLCHRPFYRKVLSLYQDSYYSIKKRNQIKTNVIDDITTVSDAYNVFVARLMSKNPDDANVFLNELKRVGVFSDRKSYTRLKCKLQNIATKADISVTDELIKELDTDIQNCGAYV